MYFGRTHGEKTLGEVVKVNRSRVKVKQIDARGGHPAGTIWSVPFELCSPVDSSVSASPSTPSEPQVSRPRDIVLKEIARVYSSLSPENLFCDGEISVSAGRRRAAVLNRQLRALFKEFGRKVSENEAFSEKAEAP